MLSSTVQKCIFHTDIAEHTSFNFVYCNEDCIRYTCGQKYMSPYLFIQKSNVFYTFVLGIQIVVPYQTTTFAKKSTIPGLYSIKFGIASNFIIFYRIHNLNIN